ncbi:MAG: tetratricopeptide repeat protein [Acidobacteriota bacterium]
MRLPVRTSAWPLAALLLLASCSPALRQADGYFKAGDYSRAASVYEEVLSTHPGPRTDARALYRLGVSRAEPGSPAFDPAKARKAFETLRRTHPGSRYAREAALPLALLDAMENASREAAQLQAQLKAELTSCSRQGQEASASAQQDRTRSQEQIQQLKALLAQRDRELEALRRQMDELKRIDLMRGR